MYTEVVSMSRLMIRLKTPAVRKAPQQLFFIQAGVAFFGHEYNLLVKRRAKVNVKNKIGVYIKKQPEITYSLLNSKAQ
jgi:hypothetical protein